MLRGKKSKGFTTSESGMTLLELAIGMIILGLIATALLPFYQIHKQKSIKETTDNSIADTQRALQQYAIVNGRYPRPAPRDLVYGDAGYGIEIPEPTIISPAPACTLNTADVCAIDSNFDRNTADANNPDLIYRGDIPFITLGLPYTTTLDGYGNRITYVVSESMTLDSLTPALLDNNWGVVEVENLAGVADSTVDKDTTDNAHFALISHGQNGVGTFTQSGTLRAPCPTVTTNWGRDVENCDLDARYTNNFALSVLSATGTPQNRRQGAFAQGVSYYDDQIKFTRTLITGKWSQYGADVAAGPFIMDGITAMKIGAQDGSTADDLVVYHGAAANDPPVAKLNIVGTNKSLRADRVLVNRLCPTGDAACNVETVINPNESNIANTFSGGIFNPSILGTDGTNSGTVMSSGGGINCGADEVLWGINGAEETCYPQDGLVKGTNLQSDLNKCPVGTYPVGILASGKLDCQ